MENHLYNTDKELSKKLGAIKDFCAEVWSDRLLPWFTNHNIEHSNQIISLMGKILLPLNNHHQFLGKHELFILLSSAYLHDIGMQFLRVDGVTPENLTRKEYDEIRKVHAAKSAEIILSQLSPELKRDDFHMPDVDEEYLPVLAQVVKGHSTDYFDEIIKYFKEDPASPKNTLVRGELLTSLLMIGDELDLQCHRVDFKQTAKFNLSDYSKMHWFKHHYVDLVMIENGMVDIKLKFPKDSDDYSGLIQKLIQYKIKEQLMRVNPIFSIHTGGLLHLHGPAFTIREDKFGAKRALPKEIIPILENELQDGNLKSNEISPTSKIPQVISPSGSSENASDKMKRGGSTIENKINKYFQGKIKENEKDPTRSYAVRPPLSLSIKPEELNIQCKQLIEGQIVLISCIDKDMAISCADRLITLPLFRSFDKRLFLYTEFHDDQPSAIWDKLSSGLFGWSEPSLVMIDAFGYPAKHLLQDHIFNRFSKDVIVNTLKSFQRFLICILNKTELDNLLAANASSTPIFNIWSIDPYDYKLSYTERQANLFSEKTEQQRMYSLKEKRLQPPNFDEKRRKAEMGLSLLKKIKSDKRDGRQANRLDELEIERIRIGNRQIEENANHSRKLEKSMQDSHNEIERLKVFSKLNIEQLIAVSDLDKSEILGDLGQSQALKGMSAEEILALKDPAALAKVFEERAKNTQSAELKDLYKQMSSRRATSKR